MSLKLPENIKGQIIKHARDEAPIEACGYLAGKKSKVEEIIPMTNIDESKEHFTFSPEEQFKVLKDTRSRGLDLIAVYHSHPETPARMSDEDIRLAYDSNCSYVIVSLLGNDVDIKSFRVKDGVVNEENLEVI